MIKTHGIHHISSMVGHAQKNIDFYAGVLGYRLVKQTLNYDDKNMYHLYYGNREANTGLVTTFPMNNTVDGQLGSGQVAVAGYGIRPNTIKFWEERLKSFGIKTFRYTKFNQNRLGFKDLDNQQIDLVETDKGPINTWEFNGVDSNNALIGIDNALIYSSNPQETFNLLTNILGYSLIDQDNENYLLQVNNELGGTLELSKYPKQRGVMGKGSVHHIAFKVLDNEIDAWFDLLVEAGFKPTKVKNRKYFKSIYFREKGGLLIELATLSPGMSVDETIDTMGTQLIIPDHYKNDDHSHLMPIQVREVSELKGYGYRDRFEYELLQEKTQIKNEIKKLKSKPQLTTLEQSQLEDLKQQYLQKGAKQNDNKTTSI